MGPAAILATALAHTACTCYWIVALILTTSFAVHFNSVTAQRWGYSCISGWLFTWFVLEIVKVMLSTILEISQLNQRSRLVDHTRLQDRVAMKKARKMKQMASLANASGIAVPKLHSLLPVPPPP